MGHSNIPAAISCHREIHTVVAVDQPSQAVWLLLFKDHGPRGPDRGQTGEKPSIGA